MILAFVFIGCLSLPKDTIENPPFEGAVDGFEAGAGGLRATILCNQRVYGVGLRRIRRAQRVAIATAIPR